MNHIMRRTKLAIGKSIIQFLKQQESAFTRADLEGLKMNSKTAEEWLELYLLFQRGPTLRKIDLGADTSGRNRFVYEVVSSE
ncbi:MAG: hypothetical protein ACFFC6_05150 [Promethearchaeota archaeon]